MYHNLGLESGLKNRWQYITYDTSKFFFGFSFSSIIQKEKNYDLKYVLAILNSNFALYWYQRNCKKRGAGFDVGVQKIRDFPIAKVQREQQKLLIILVDKILDAKRKDLGSVYILKVLTFRSVFSML